MDKSQIQNKNNESGNRTTFKQNKMSNPIFGKFASISSTSQFTMAATLSKYKSKLIGSTSLVKLIQMLKKNICLKTICDDIGDLKSPKPFMNQYIEQNSINDSIMINEIDENTQNVWRLITCSQHDDVNRGVYVS